MRLENIIALTHAKLLNDPFVKEFSSITFDLSLLKRGDLFVAFNPQDVYEAIELGAYAILFDKPLQIVDTEVAWIKVENLQTALLRLLRFRLIELEVETYSCEPIMFHLIEQIETFSQLYFTTTDITTLFKRLWNIPPKSTILYPNDFSYKEIFIEEKPFPIIQKNSITLIEKTLFEVSFIFCDIYYEEILLSPYFLPYLEKILNFFQSRNIPFKLKKFNHVDFFEIYFTNKNLELKEKGSSEQVLFFETHSAYFEEQMDFLENFAPWAKIIYILPTKIKATRSNTFFYEEKNEIIDYIKENNFHYAYIAGVKSDILLQHNLTKPKQLTLFS